MKPFDKFFILLCAFCFFCFSCTPSLYVPNDGHTLQVSEKGDLRASAGFGGAGNSAILTGQVAYSPIKGLAVAGNFFKLTRGDQGINQAPQSNTSHLFEGAVGTYFFKGFGNNTNSNATQQDGILFDLYGGAGFGRTNTYYFTGGESTLNYNKYYLQGGITLLEQSSKNKFFSIGYNLKVSLLDYQQGLVKGDIGTIGYRSVKLIENSEPFVGAEYTLSIQAGGKKTRMFANMTRMQELGDKNFEHARSSFRTGVLLDVDQWLTKKKKTDSTPTTNPGF